MNNIDRNKLLKMLLTLAVICLIAGALARLAAGGSMSLTEYVKENGGTLPEEPTEAAGSADIHRSAEADKANSPQSAGTSTPDTSEAAEALSALVGASLNGDSQKKERFCYAEGFYYEPLSEHLCRYITGISYPAFESQTVPSEQAMDAAAPEITYEELRYLHILHYDFQGEPVEGELICNQAIAQDLVEIFYELYCSEYQLERVHLIDEYNGDDNASMEDNNTSCFNYRVVEGSSSLSKHALGLAVDINPLYNPYVTYEKDGSETIAPAAAVSYADRDAAFPYKIDENDLCYRLFKEHGFTWGGDWNSCKDYQHFQKIP